MMDNKLSAAIDELVETRTFNLDALGAITGLRDRAVALDAQVETQKRAIEQRDGAYRELQATQAKAQRDLEAWIAREADLKAREAKVRELELREAVATAKAQTLDGVFGTIFRNVTIREQTLKSVPQQLQQPGGYSAQVMATETSSVERSAE